MITITENAQRKLVEILKEENDNGLYVRMYVHGGGCSGFQYGFQLTKEKADDDYVIPVLAQSVLIDTISMQYLSTAVVDYQENVEESKFVISNPMAKTTCGCGSSFDL